MNDKADAGKDAYGRRIVRVSDLIVDVIDTSTGDVARKGVHISGLYAIEDDVSNFPFPGSTVYLDAISSRDDGSLYEIDADVLDYNIDPEYFDYMESLYSEDPLA